MPSVADILTEDGDGDIVFYFTKVNFERTSIIILFPFDSKQKPFYILKHLDGRTHDLSQSQVINIISNYCQSIKCFRKISDQFKVIGYPALVNNFHFVLHADLYKNYEKTLTYVSLLNEVKIAGEIDGSY